MKLNQFPAFLKIGMAIGLMSGCVRAADDELPDNTLSEWKFGETLFGDKADAKDLEGKVVAIEYWGTR